MVEVLSTESVRTSDSFPSTIMISAFSSSERYSSMTGLAAFLRLRIGSAFWDRFVDLYSHWTEIEAKLPWAASIGAKLSLLMIRTTWLVGSSISSTFVTRQSVVERCGLYNELCNGIPDGGRDPDPAGALWIARHHSQLSHSLGTTPRFCRLEGLFFGIRFPFPHLKEALAPLDQEI